MNQALTIAIVIVGYACLSVIAYEEKPQECTFPFTYMGQEFQECTDVNGARPWCSKTKVYNGSWVYCAKKVGDLITNDHFLTLIDDANKLEERMKNLHQSTNAKSSQCSDCQLTAVELSKWVDIQKRVFLDQNKRIEGLNKNVNRLRELQRKLKIARQRRNCRQTTSGQDYLGKITKSSHAYTCQAWTAQSPYKHGNTLNDQYPDNRVSRAKNYCRNPDNEKEPWCYTTSGKKRYDYCRIPLCNKDCKLDEDDTKSTLPLCDQYKSLSCSLGYQYYKLQCYKVESRVKRTFQDAENACKKEGGHLASVNSYEENRFVASILPHRNEKYWIGATDQNHEGKFTWTDGTKLTKTFFHSGEPNNNARWGQPENCVLLNWFTSMKWSWNDYTCRGKVFYVCKKAAT